MKVAVQMQKTRAIVYDASRMDCPSADIFQVEYWRSRQALTGEATGRGSAWFLDSPFGALVLRQYLRGGLAAKVSRRHYFYTKVSRSRPFREFNILAELSETGLPVPRPVAAICEFHGLTSSGVILMEAIPSSRTLADVLSADQSSMERTWHAVGHCIRQFHNAGVWHADLNARNILVDNEYRVFLIDFDRARYMRGKLVKAGGNLKRLKRSLIKLWPSESIADLETAWEHLMVGYHD